MRVSLASVTVGFGVLGLVYRLPRLLVAAGAFGVLWTLWDMVWDRILAPFGDWALTTFTEGASGPPANTRPTLDDTIRLLESHLAGHAEPHVQIQAAIRLEEIYRTVRHDAAKADDVVRRILDRYPTAPELRRFKPVQGADR